MSKRTRTKYPGLHKNLSLPIRADLIDQDYIDKLTDKEKQWLNNFNEEWVNCNIRKDKARFHKSKKDRKIINDMNNARNRDVFSRHQARGTLKSESEILHEKPNYEVENNLIEKIDIDLENIKVLKKSNPT